MTEPLRGALSIRGLWREGAPYYNGDTPEATYWYRPLVELVDSEGSPAIQWTLVQGTDPKWLYDPSTISTDAGGMLNAFLLLPSRSAGAVLQFASRFGVLALCVHSRPNGHTYINGGEYKHCPSLDVEPVALWMRWANTFRAIASLASELHRGAPGAATDWALLESLQAEHGVPIYHQSRDRLGLAGYVNQLIGLAGLSWRFFWEEDERPGLELTAANVANVSVFWVLVRELIFMLARSEKPVFCGECGALIISPARRPTATRRAYCETCRKLNAKNRVGQRARRDRARGTTNGDSDNG